MQNIVMPLLSPVIAKRAFGEFELGEVGVTDSYGCNIIDLKHQYYIVMNGCNGYGCGSPHSMQQATLKLTDNGYQGPWEYGPKSGNCGPNLLNQVMHANNYTKMSEITQSAAQAALKPYKFNIKVDFQLTPYNTKYISPFDNKDLIFWQHRIYSSRAWKLSEMILLWDTVNKCSSDSVFLLDSHDEGEGSGGASIFWGLTNDPGGIPNQFDTYCFSESDSPSYLNTGWYMYMLDDPTNTSSYDKVHNSQYTGKMRYICNPNGNKSMIRDNLILLAIAHPDTLPGIYRDIQRFKQ